MRNFILKPTFLRKKTLLISSERILQYYVKILKSYSLFIGISQYCSLQAYAKNAILIQWEGTTNKQKSLEGVSEGDVLPSLFELFVLFNILTNIRMFSYETLRLQETTFFSLLQKDNFKI